ncbi:hypothetical protein NLU14_07900 [Marinobacter sp. 71-i]|uniref:ATP-grasp domain-containing protein n=1 Tax=Marinobacter iranensis TaxID=2962607 RepID=A0ABT5Y9B1_9GAMM|nr:hypothetical protein [Marinobacter iranensis]MDF0750154.1 hypothetical protein [Marinobacter iranensis]
MIKNNVLVITNKEDVTVDFVIEALKVNKINYYRFNTEDIGSNISISFDSAGYALFDHKKSKIIKINEFGSIYFRRPKLPPPMPGLTIGEQQFYLNEISTYLEGIYRNLSSNFWLNSVFDIRMIENKPYQIELARSIGFSVPSFCVSNNVNICNDFFRKHDFCIFKPLKVGLIEEPEGVGKVLYTTKVDSNFIEKIKTNGAMPIYLQQQVIKKCDIRVTLVGNKIFGAKILSQNSDISRVDWRRSDSMLAHEKVDIPSKLKDKCLRLCKLFNLNFAAIDFVLDNSDRFWFLEINPNGQWAWIESLLGYPISNEIAELLASGGKDDRTNH